MPERDFAESIERWFRRTARALPWRGDGRTPYAALVSEAMLQQTQVARVVEAFVAFIRRFPDVAALARADEQEVLAAWRGLGYYRRARLLHAAARMVVDRFGGEIPADVAALRTLPGVGRYTAGAIASIVFGERAAIVDGNVARVLLRVHGRDADQREREVEAWTWEEAQRLVDTSRDPAQFNEGLMELGALVCTPRSPECGACPVASHCAAHAQGIVERIPAPRRSAARQVVVHHVVVVRRGERILVEQRPTAGLWASMWQPLTIEAGRELSIDELREVFPLNARKLERVGGFVHLTSHREVRVVIHVASTRSRRGRWVDGDEMERLPMSSAARRALQLAAAVRTDWEG